MEGNVLGLSGGACRYEDWGEVFKVDEWGVCRECRKVGIRVVCVIKEVGVVC